MAIPMSMLPLEIWFAMSCVALRPEEQKRFTVEAAVVLGKPAASAAARTRYAAFPSLTWLVLENARSAGEGQAYIATADILDQPRIDFRLINDFLEQRIDEIIELCVL
jgi:hypothetical protein